MKQGQMLHTVLPCYLPCLIYFKRKTCDKDLVQPFGRDFSRNIADL